MPLKLAEFQRDIEFWSMSCIETGCIPVRGLVTKKTRKKSNNFACLKSGGSVLGKRHFIVLVLPKMLSDTLVHAFFQFRNVHLKPHMLKVSPTEGMVILT